MSWNNADTAAAPAGNDWGNPVAAPAGDHWGNPAAASSDVAAKADEGFGNGGGITEELTDEQKAAVEAQKMEQHQYLEKARGAGWTGTTAFDYNEYIKTGGSKRSEWAAGAQVYEWDDEYGDVGPELPELAEQLFGGQFQMQKGPNIENLVIPVSIEGPSKISPIRKFDDAGLHPVVLKNIAMAGYDFPTPIQTYVLPIALKGHDIVAIAQTGSGKTAAYLVPILSKLMGKAKKLSAPRPNLSAPNYDPRTHRTKAEPLVVVVVPTRELAVQIFDEARRMCYRSMLRPVVMYGGLPMDITREELGKGCDILVSTPGRLCDFMGKPHLFTMARVKYTVIDEADELLDADWEEELKKIMTGGDSNEDADHVFMMFSATFPKPARQLAREFMTEDHYRIRVGRPGSVHKNVKQNIVYVDQGMKKDAVFDLLYQMEPGRTIIFCNSKITVDLIDDFLYNRGLPTTSIHGDRNQREREDAMRAFRTGRAPILIATGISARGWDVKGVKHIINYDLPSSMYGGITEYVHRIGRTARIGNVGLATSFYNDRNEDIAQDLVNLLAECEAEVPEFLSQLKPEDGAMPNFDDDSDEEEEEGEAGGEAAAAEGAVAISATGWGLPAAEATTAVSATGWGPPAPEATATADAWNATPAAATGGVDASAW